MTAPPCGCRHRRRRNGRVRRGARHASLRGGARGRARARSASAVAHRQIHPPGHQRNPDSVGAMERFPRRLAPPVVGSCSAWASGRAGLQRLCVQPPRLRLASRPAPFDAFLAEHAIGAGAEIRRGLRFRRVERRADGMLELHLSSPAGSSELLPARIAVDATGSAAHLARALGARRFVHDRLSCFASLARPAEASVLRVLTMLEAVSRLVVRGTGSGYRFRGRRHW